MFWHVLWRQYQYVQASSQWHAQIWTYLCFLLFLAKHFNSHLIIATGLLVLETIQKNRAGVFSPPIMRITFDTTWVLVSLALTQNDIARLIFFVLACFSNAAAPPVWGLLSPKASEREREVVCVCVQQRGFTHSWDEGLPAASCRVDHCLSHTF